MEVEVNENVVKVTMPDGCENHELYELKDLKKNYINILCDRIIKEKTKFKITQNEVLLLDILLKNTEGGSL